MSTLARDFREESGDAAAWDRAAARHFVAWYGKPHGIEDADEAIADILRGMEFGIPGLTFPLYLHLGRALRADRNGCPCATHHAAADADEGTTV